MEGNMRSRDEIARRIDSLDAEMLSTGAGYLKLARNALEWVLTGDFKVENIGTDEIMAFEMHDGRNLVVWTMEETTELKYEVLEHPCSLCHINEAEDGVVCNGCKAIGGS